MKNDKNFIEGDDTLNIIIMFFFLFKCDSYANFVANESSFANIKIFFPIFVFPSICNVFICACNEISQSEIEEKKKRQPQQTRKGNNTT